MDDLVKDFLVETVEAVGALDNDLVHLEAEPENVALLATVFRTIHTIKGTCGFLDLVKLGRVAHAGENILGRLRDTTLVATPAVFNAILGCVDAIKEIVATLEATGAEGETDYAELLANLDAICHGEPTAETATPPGTAPQSATAEAGAGEPTARAVAAVPLVPAAAEAQSRAATLAPVPAGVGEAGRVSPVAVAPANTVDAGTSRELAVASQTVRVSIELLEGLMTTVSELVLTRNQLLQLLRGQQESVFGAPLQHLSMITSELQESVMKARMQPIGNAWTALPRIVRDLAQELGKKIELVMEGADTELDRQVLELIKDPLTHMVRNSADHGLEMSADRRAAGKSETGRIRLTAFHEGGHIIIQVSDDGHGLNVERIRRKAVQNGLATEAEVIGMPDARVFRFIMRPGFSTATVVTAVSGRGVGMDVVRTNIERIGGTIDIASHEGRGSTFTIKLPLTLAIISALIVGCSGERFAVPQITVVELVRVGASAEHRIERVKDSQVLRLRNRLLPLIDLRDLLALDSADAGIDDSLVIVAQAGAWNFGIIVDNVYDTEEIVVKPVVPLLKSLGVYAGNTILGDGSVCMILDPVGLVARLRGAGIDASGGQDVDLSASSRRSGSDMMRLLLVRAGAGMRKAIPLDLVSRIEEIETAAIHHSDGRMLVHYNDRLMPLMPAADDVAPRSEGKQPVLVFTEQETSGRKSGQQIGVVVDEVIDIVESTVRLQVTCDRPDIIGSAIINGTPTEVINAAHFLKSIGEDWRSSNARDDHRSRVLLADESAFSRQLIASTLEVANFEVHTARSGEDALAIVQDDESIELLLFSTDMPGIGGYELARRVRQGPRSAHLPVVGLSPNLNDNELQQGLEAGFSAHVAKLDQKRLLDTVKQLLQNRELVA